MSIKIDDDSYSEATVKNGPFLAYHFELEIRKEANQKARESIYLVRDLTSFLCLSFFTYHFVRWHFHLTIIHQRDTVHYNTSFFKHQAIEQLVYTLEKCALKAASFIIYILIGKL